MVFEFVFVNNTGRYVEINGFSNGLNICFAKSYFFNEICCVRKQNRTSKRKHEHPRCTVLIEALVQNLFIGYIFD